MFLLFGGKTYYPGGGWYDFKGVFSSLKEAVEAGTLLFEDKDPDGYWFQVVDFQEKTIVYRFGYNMEDIWYKYDSVLPDESH